MEGVTYKYPKDDTTIWSQLSYLPLSATIIPMQTLPPEQIQQHNCINSKI